MNLNKRIHKLEVSAGLGDRPKLLLFTTYYQRKDGGSDLFSARAIVTGSQYFNQLHDPSVMRKGATETLTSFKDRICNFVEEKTGKRPLHGVQCAGADQINFQPPSKRQVTGIDQ